MTKSAETPKAMPNARKKAAKFTTATVVSFSLTLFVGSLAILSGAVPMKLSAIERVDIGAMLFVVPILALVLAVMVETTRIALSRQPLPQPRQKQVVRNWQPGRREG